MFLSAHWCRGWTQQNCGLVFGCCRAKGRKGTRAYGYLLFLCLYHFPFVNFTPDICVRKPSLPDICEHSWENLICAEHDENLIWQKSCSTFTLYRLRYVILFPLANLVYSCRSFVPFLSYMTRVHYGKLCTLSRECTPFCLSLMLLCLLHVQIIPWPARLECMLGDIWFLYNVMCGQ